MTEVLRITAYVNELFLCDPHKNKRLIIQSIEEARGDGAGVVCFGGMPLCGNVMDMFFQATVVSAVRECLDDIARITDDETAVLMPAPLVLQNRLYHCAVLMTGGRIAFAVPKLSLSWQEKRWFSDTPPETEGGITISHSAFKINGAPVFIEFNARAEHDGIVVHLDNSPHVAGDFSDLSFLTAVSGKGGGSCHVYVNAPVSETTTDSVFNGYSAIVENGRVLSETPPYSFETQRVSTDILLNLYKNKQPGAVAASSDISVRCVTSGFRLRLEKFPFIPGSSDAAARFFEDTLNMQAAGLAGRARHIGCETFIFGLSGGLDSALTMVASMNACKMLGLSTKQAIAVIMPGFGTSERTIKNASTLINHLDITHTIISIEEACKAHLRDIGHGGERDVAYENCQARERTQILFDLANMKNGIVVGSGDMTEIALGFSTYNGDHMCSYNVNGNIPKTLVRVLIRYLAKQPCYPVEVRNAFSGIADTPISAELLPTAENGDIAQKTEEIIGPYDINDFIMYYTLKYGLEKETMRFLLGIAFGDEYSGAKLDKTLDGFYRRFIQNQFKRSCSPDGARVLDFSLSPRGGFMMPSDLSVNLFCGESRQ